MSNPRTRRSRAAGAVLPNGIRRIADRADLRNGQVAVPHLQPMLHPQKGSEPAVFSDALLTGLPRRPVTEVWNRAETLALWRHLHNYNPPFSYVMGFRKDGKILYRRSKTLNAERAMTWALATVEGKKESGKELAYVPYSTNPQHLSRWGGMDFDAHDGNAARAQRLAFAALRFFLSLPYGLILETSGSAGWHLWILSPGFQPTGSWNRLLKTAAQSIGAAIQSGECELFPSDALAIGFGKGMRAPGCWNPTTGACSQIVWQDAADLFPYIRETECHLPSASFPERERNLSFSSPLIGDGALSVVAAAVGDGVCP